MSKIDDRFKEIRAFCEKNANPDIVKKYSRFFTEGYDAYGLTQEIFESQRDKWLEAWNKDFTIKDYLRLGDRLVSTGKYEEASVAVSFVYSNTDQFTPETFDRLGNWLDIHPAGVYGWAGDMDDPIAIELTHSGDHRIRIQPRQTPHRIDQIWLSRSQYRIPDTSEPIK